MMCGGLYQCTYGDLLINGFAVVGIGLWLLSWILHMSALFYARKYLFLDAKEAYVAKCRSLKQQSPKKTLLDRNSEGKRINQPFPSWFSRRTTKLNDSNRFVKLTSNYPAKTVGLQEVVVDSKSSTHDRESQSDTKRESEVDMGRTEHFSSGDLVGSGHELPGVSILKPVCGIDSTLAENLESFFRLDYPRFELLFCLHSETDTAIPVIKKLMATYRNVDASLLIGARWIGVNPKINNMHQGYEKAKYDLLLISDSGLLTQPDTLTQMVFTMLSDDRNGIVHQLPFINLDIYSHPDVAASFGSEDDNTVAADASHEPVKSSSPVASVQADAQKSIAHAASVADNDLHRSRSFFGREWPDISSDSTATTRKKASHKHSMSVDINSSLRSSGAHIALSSQRSVDAHEGAQSDWTELDLQLNESINMTSQNRSTLSAHLRNATLPNSQPSEAEAAVRPGVACMVPVEAAPIGKCKSEVSSPQLTQAVIGVHTTKTAAATNTRDPSATHLNAKTKPKSKHSKSSEANDRRVLRRFSAFVSAVQVVYFGAQHARMYLSAQFFRINCVNGMSTLLRKRILEECGGLSSFANYLAEDYFIAQKIIGAGYKTPMCSRVALQNTNVTDSVPATIKQFQSRVQRWYVLRISMLPHTIFLEPCGEVLPIGIYGSWSLIQLFDCTFLHPLAIFLLHSLVWFFLDYILIQTVARSARMRSSCPSARPGDESDDSTVSSDENASYAYAGASSAKRRLLPFSKADLFAAWLYRESTSLLVQLQALPQRYIVWRNKTYRIRWGGHTEQIA